MLGAKSLGRQFGWLWSAYAVSTYGSYLALDAFALVAIYTLDAGPLAVSMLAAAGLAVGAVVALPLGPWVEFRRKRPVMIAMDLVRFVALLSVVATYAMGLLTFLQLLMVSVIVATADIAFRSASGAYLKSLVRPDDLLIANGRFESTMWTATAIGPPLGGVLIGVFGPATTVLANAASFLLSAVGLRAITATEPAPALRDAGRLRVADLLDGWRYILNHPALRPLFFNTVAVNSLIMATAPLLAVLMLGDLGFAPWQYGLAFGGPCIGGLVGSRLASGLVARFGRDRVTRVSGTFRALWSIGLVFIGPGVGGLILVIVVELALITSIGVFNPVYSTYRLEQTDNDRIARMLSAWSITANLMKAATTAIWGVLAAFTTPRIAIGIAGLLLLATPLLLARRSKSEDTKNGKESESLLSTFNL
ncbi:MFS transporter [Antrihabitans cavernicola]|uniref:MFS transporter n=1 Tax=Antrihabitans cavernicola TaxID=2495913 RepID=A0A5A7S894_9NOCA|nr:MFS transporter [Spelaeibacter cavernicola]KAA0022146.1 MFS transporter [Spelaeibacter cavernicola]